MATTGHTDRRVKPVQCPSNKTQHVFVTSTQHVSLKKRRPPQKKNQQLQRPQCPTDSTHKPGPTH
ncbi:hypothetical protein INR49_020909 [Caranx melampygus]|nr:hypothetical protein INR49_020909 [Caranx melampygus]